MEIGQRHVKNDYDLVLFMNRSEMDSLADIVREVIPIEPAIDAVAQKRIGNVYCQGKAKYPIEVEIAEVGPDNYRAVFSPAYEYKFKRPSKYDPVGIAAVSELRKKLA